MQSSHVTTNGSVDAEEVLWHLGALLTVKASSDHTGGRYALVEELGRKGMAPPLHVHSREDEALYVIDGELTVWVGDRRMATPAGAFAFLPRHIPHAFRIESETARFLNLITPGGMEGFFREVGVPAPQLVIPPPLDGPPDVAAIAAAAARYGTEILGPPPVG